MESQQELAARLAAGLQRLDNRGPLQINRATTAKLASLTSDLHALLSAMPDDIRHLIHTADSGFASTGDWVTEAIAGHDKAVAGIARGSGVLAGWVGPGGLDTEKLFFTRGNIRAWAHRWRTEEKGTAQVDTDPDFVTFASECLQEATVAGDYPAMIAKALLKEWRTA